MSYIAHIETYIVDIPTVRPHKLSVTSMAVQSMVIVRVRDNEGREGVGEGTTIGGLAYGPESPESIKLNIDTYFVQHLLNQPLNNIKKLMLAIDKSCRGNAIAKSAIETALLDLQGKILGVPVSTLLGGACNSHLPCLWVLASGDTEQDIEEARALIAERRHNVFKLKIGSRHYKDDVAHVSKIKATLGDEISIRVDVNQAWDEPTATLAMAALQEVGVDLVEQPTPARDFSTLARLAQKCHMPILADESVLDATDGVNLSRAGFGGAVALKIAKAGGLTGALNLASVCHGAGFGLYGGTMLEGTIGTVASLHTWAALPKIQWGTEMFGPLLQKDDIVKVPLTYANNGVEIPTLPGLGVEIDEDKFSQYVRK